LTWLHTKQENSNIVVEISDDGPGITQDIQPRIFEQFFTTKGIGKGTGLGHM
jgi:signal transduction histidine kinase